MQIKLNYFLLFAVISIGVTVGNLVSNWLISNYFKNEIENNITAEPISSPDIPSKPIVLEKHKSEIEEQTRETVKLSPENLSETEVKDTPINTEELMEQRKVDENGIRLAKQCSEWTVVHKDMQTKTSERGMNKYCDQYYDYISFGTLPEEN